MMVIEGKKNKMVYDDIFPTKLNILTVIRNDDLRH